MLSISNKISEIEENIIEDIKELSLDLEYIELVNENNKDILRIVIDTLDEKSVTFEDCEKVTRKVEEKLDKLIDKEYILEVSSPGVERNLKNLKLFKKYIGYEIHIKLFRKINVNDENIKEFNCKLIDVLNDEVIKLKLIDYNNSIVEVNYKDISKANTIYDFNERKDKDGNK